MFCFLGNIYIFLNTKFISHLGYHEIQITLSIRNIYGVLLCSKEKANEELEKKLQTKMIIKL